VKVEYSLHPQHGQELPVVRYEGADDACRVLVQLTDNCVFLPIWMTDVHVCSRLTSGLLPFCAWNALLEVHEFLLAVDQGD
jgi:hypothetical protein